MTNKMIARLKKESITIHEHDSKADFFAFGYDNEVFVPKNVDLNSSNSQFSLAHELGHVYQFQEAGCFKKRANTYCREDNDDCGLLHSFFFSLYLLWIELDAWVKGYAILQEEGIGTNGYVPYAWECYKSYVVSELKKALKYILPFYLIITLIGYLTTILTGTIDWNTFWTDSVLIFSLIFACYEFVNISITVYESYEMKKELKKSRL